MATTLGRANPFRYRGYYYDTETGWYYLNSRYYDPSVGRFINADAFIGINGGLQGNNLFAYCNNNPGNFYDVDGYFIATLIGTIGGAISAIARGDNILVGMGAGAAKGFVSGIIVDTFLAFAPAAPIIAVTAVGFASGVAGGYVEHGINTAGNYYLENGTLKGVDFNMNDPNVHINATFNGVLNATAAGMGTSVSRFYDDNGATMATMFGVFGVASDTIISTATEIIKSPITEGMAAGANGAASISNGGTNANGWIDRAIATGNVLTVIPSIQKKLDAVLDSYIKG